MSAADILVGARFQSASPHPGVALMSRRAVLARINRALAQIGEKVYLPRSARERSEFGECYLRDTATGALCAWHCTLEGVGREIGVLRDFEQVSE